MLFLSVFRKRPLSEKRQRKLLQKNNLDDLPVLHLIGEIVPCSIVDIYDGDTITVVYIYRKTPLKIKLRLLGIDAPEIKGKDVTDLEHEVAIKARDLLRKWINLTDPEKIYLKLKQFDKYGGRFLGDILIKTSAKKQVPEYEVLSTLLLETGVVAPYSGAKKLEWTTKRLREIKKLADS